MDPTVFRLMIHAETEKYAVFGIEEAIRVGRRFKARQMAHQSLLAKAEIRFGGIPPGAMDDYRKQWGIAGRLVPKSVDKFVMKYLPEGRTVGPPRGDALNFLRSQWADLPGKRNYTPRDRILLEGIVKKHEIDEATSTIGRVMAPYRHSSLPVILREHNAAKQLRDQGDYRVANLIGRMRRGPGREEEFIKSIYPGYAHGVSPKISRHAQRRLSEIAERRAQPLSWYQRILGGK